MKTKSKRIKRTVTTIVMLALLLVQGAAMKSAYAYYTHESMAHNVMEVQDGEVILKERFDAADNWLPGETKLKEVWFANTGTTDQVLRFKPTAAWIAAPGFDPVNNTEIKNNLPEIQFTKEVLGNDGNYTTVDADGSQLWQYIDGYFYYKKIFPAATLNGSNVLVPSQTSNVISGVKFTETMSNDGSHAIDYSNKTYSLKINMETVDVDTAKTAVQWSRNFTVSSGVLTWS